MVLLNWTNSISDWINVFIVQWYIRLKFLILKIFAFLTICVVLFWLSMFMYGSFYYFYMPSVSHSWPVYLQFGTDCHEEVGKLCSIPRANFSLLHHSDSTLLMQGQAYVITVELNLPESPINRELGMFMVLLEMYTYHGEIVRSSQRSAMLTYKSPLLQVLETIFFLPKLLLLEGVTQSQRILVTLFDDYYEHPYKPSQGVHVAVNSRHIQIYSASLAIYARFSGLRYIMFHWPLISMIAGISCNMFFLTIVALFSWYRFIVEPQLAAIKLQKEQQIKQQHEQRKKHARSVLERQTMKGQFPVVPSVSVPSDLNLLPHGSVRRTIENNPIMSQRIVTLSHAEEDIDNDEDTFFDSLPNSASSTSTTTFADNTVLACTDSNIRKRQLFKETQLVQPS